MKALNIIFPEQNRVDLAEVEVPPPAPNEILCRADKSLVSTGTELSCLRGEFDPQTGWAAWVQYPFNPGYSMSATVLSVGEAVEGFQEGDRIATDEAHKQFFALDPGRATLLPDEVSMEDGTWVTLSVTTQLGVRRAELELGETVGVIGLGILGQLCVQYLKAAGAKHIVAIDPIAKRLQLARTGGATHTLNCDAETAIEQVARITGGKMLDVVMDVTGHPAVLSPATRMVRRLGRVVLLGDAVAPSRQVLGPRVVADSVAILGIHGLTYPPQASIFHPWSRDGMVALFLEYLKQKRMDLSHLVSHRYSPLDAPKVYEWLLENRTEAMGVIFDWNAM